MATIVENINKIADIKQNIKEAISNKGIEVSDNIPFETYPSLIDSIEGGGSENSYLQFLDVPDLGGAYKRERTITTLFSIDCSKLPILKGGYYLFYYFTGKINNVDKMRFDNGDNAINCDRMFAYSSLEGDIDLSQWITNGISTVDYMFHNNTNISSVNLSNISIKTTTYSNMFRGCENLKNVDMSYTTNNSYLPRTTTSMFNGCTLLESINFSGCEFKNLSSTTSMFKDCNALSTIYMYDCSEESKQMIEGLKPSNAQIIY